MSHTRTTWKAALAIAALAVGMGGILGCDGDDETGTGGGGPGGNTTGQGGQGGEGASGGGGSTGQGGGQGGSGGEGGGSSFPISGSRLDLLLVLDNSRSMADKQQILALAIPDLIQRLINPRCVDGAGGSVDVSGPLDPCPAGHTREFAPVSDMHIGVLTSSLGGHGADVCNANSPATQSSNDRGRLIARTAPEVTNDLETYESQGFLAWDPAMQLTPAGEADLDMDSGADANTTALVPQLVNMVVGAGQIGCGYESQLESWYRFLIDPEPYETISVVNGQATPQGTDTVLLQQRADFLRSGSTLAVLVLSDENDCSIREAGQYYFAAQQTSSNGSKFHLPRARQECETNPNDPCCKSCGQSAGNCPVDPTCYANGDPSQGPLPLTDLEDAPNLRCFEQKRRFGIDFLYPIERYIAGLTETVITNRQGEVVPNPLFMDLDPTDEDTTLRTPAQVFLAGIVGVPWQDLARDPSDLGQGFKSAAELLEPAGAYASAWEVILGDPAGYLAPADPFMRESITPRSGQNPITGDAITPPGGSPNPINGTEFTVPENDDLQYACIFDLPQDLQRDCSVPGTPACDCAFNPDSPLCEGTLQVRAKAYPGLRHLQLLEGIEKQAVVTSLCPAQVSDDTRDDYGYRPAMRSIVEALAPQL